MAHDDFGFHDQTSEGAFGSLALQVVSVLKARHAQTQAKQARPHIRSILDRRLTTRAHFNPSDTLDELRALRLSDAEIIDYYIPEAARAIGEKWVDNSLGFADVTIASVRLQSLLTEVEFLRPETSPGFDLPIDVLVVVGEHEQHTLGAFVIAAQLRRRGAIVETLCGEPEKEIRRRILMAHYDAVLFSSSRTQDLDSIAGTVSYVRDMTAEAPVFALGGIVLGKVGNIQRRTGMDLVSNDVDKLVSFCEQRSIRHPEQASR